MLELNDNPSLGAAAHRALAGSRVQVPMLRNTGLRDGEADRMLGELPALERLDLPRRVPQAMPAATSALGGAASHLQTACTLEPPPPPGRTLHERDTLLTSIAHPDDREGLERAWHEISARR